MESHKDKLKHTRNNRENKQKIACLQQPFNFCQAKKTAISPFLEHKRSELISKCRQENKFL